MQYAMQVFEDAEHQEFRVIDRNGEPWFVLAEVCRRLEIGNTSDAARRLDDDEKDALDIVDPIGRRQRTTVINESGLYSLILTSRKEQAKRFKKWVTSDVLPSIRKTGSYRGQTPAFIQRFNTNFDRLLPGFFSIISELAIRVHGRLEMLGYTMPDKGPDGRECRPDVSVGQTFPRWLGRHHPELVDRFEMYEHTTPEWTGPARQYHRSVLPAYLDFVDTVWLPQYGEPYFRKRDPIALQYLPKLLQGGDARIAMPRRSLPSPKLTRRAS